MAIPGQTTSNIVGSTWHPQTPEEAAMERMQLERQWELEDKKKAGQDWWNQKAMEQRWSEMRRGEEEARMREAFNKVYGPRVESAWRMGQGEIVAPRPAGVPSNWVARSAPNLPSRLSWGPAKPMPQGYAQQNLGSWWDMARANALLQAGGMGW
jgi:hypothetical protein